MKKKKMTADNVEQLMEIVRSLQRGEDPAEQPLQREKEIQPDTTEEIQPDTTEEIQPDTTEEIQPDTTEEFRADTTEEPRPDAVEPAKSDASVMYQMDDDDEDDDWIDEKEFERLLDEDNEDPFTSAAPRKILEKASSFWGSLENRVKEARKAQAARKTKAVASEPEKAEADEVESDEVESDEAKSESGGVVQEEKDTADKGKILAASGSFHDKFRGFWQKLRSNLMEKGISKREMSMIGMGLLLAVLVLVFVARMISGNIEVKKKSQNVTADDGLTVTVESEPEAWCNSYPVALKFQVKGEEIQQIMVNDTVCTPDENGVVTFEAASWNLEAQVQSDSGTKTAQIELPYLDGEVPVVHAAREGDGITLTAADTRSGVEEIYYAQMSPNDPIQIPDYQKYSDSIAFTENQVYYFYAVDAAGNRSIPIETNMETAIAIVPKNDTLSLFPGESSELGVRAEPTLALLNNVRYESMNPEMLSVDSNGKVTALKEGTGTVKAMADGLPDVICTIEVSSERTITVSAIGDCTLGTDVNLSSSTSFDAFDQVYGHSYFFQNIASQLEADDVTFANFEGTLTTLDTRATKEFAFKGDPSYTEILKDGSIDVVTLANNHSSDYGEQSLIDTESALAEAGIDYCIGDTIAMKTVKGIKTAFIGIYVLDDGMAREEQVRQTIQTAKTQGAQLIIVAFHWGSEKETQPDETQKSLAHTAVDCGADLVVGHHPHVLQGVENYKGKYIAYSLGNFCFGGNSTPSDLDTMIFRQTFTIQNGSVLSDDAIEVIPCSISSAEGYNNYQPTQKQGDAAAAVITKLNQYCEPFGLSFSEDGTLTE